MQTKITLTIETQTSEQVRELAGSLITIIETLTQEEINMVASMIKEKPEILAKVRPLINSTEDLSNMQILNLVWEFRKILKS